MERISRYAILRLIPEAYRGEQFNIGVVVFADTHLDVRIRIQPRFVSALGLDPDKLDWIQHVLEHADKADLPTEERRERLAEFPGFGMSELGWFVAEDQDEYEARLDRVRRDYVDRPKVAPVSVRRNSSLTRLLREEFRSRRVMGRRPEDLDNHKVVANVAVGPSDKLNVDFLAKNGLFHATETVDFSRSIDTGVSELKGAALAAYTLRYAKKELGSDITQCYFVYLAPTIIENGISPALSMVENDVDMLFNLKSADDKQRYFDIMLSALGSPPLFNS